MLTYALAESTAWECWLISFFAFLLDPILPYQYVSVWLFFSHGPLGLEMSRGFRLVKTVRGGKEICVKFKFVTNSISFFKGPAFRFLPLCAQGGIYKDHIHMFIYFLFVMFD